jgi:uncharacterized membrane protein YgcG
LNVVEKRQAVMRKFVIVCIYIVSSFATLSSAVSMAATSARPLSDKQYERSQQKPNGRANAGFKNTLNSRLNDKQAMTCIYSDKSTESTFQDLQAIFGLRMVEAKEFFKVMNTATSCPELKNKLRGLRQQLLAKFPGGPMKTPTASSGSGSSAGSSSASSAGSGAGSASAGYASPYSYGSGTTSGTFGAPPMEYEPAYPSDFGPPPAFGPPADDDFGDDF